MLKWERNKNKINDTPRTLSTLRCSLAVFRTRQLRTTWRISSILRRVLSWSCQNTKTQVDAWGTDMWNLVQSNNSSRHWRRMGSILEADMWTCKQQREGSRLSLRTNQCQWGAKCYLWRICLTKLPNNKSRSSLKLAELSKTLEWPGTGRLNVSRDSLTLTTKIMAA